MNREIYRCLIGIALFVAMLPINCGTQIGNPNLEPTAEDLFGNKYKDVELGIVSTPTGFNVYYLSPIWEVIAANRSTTILTRRDNPQNATIIVQVLFSTDVQSYPTFKDWVVAYTEMSADSLAAVTNFAGNRGLGNAELTPITERLRSGRANIWMPLDNRRSPVVIEITGIFNDADEETLSEGLLTIQVVHKLSGNVLDQ